MDEDQNESAFNLHVMNDDGTGVKQVTFNQSHDLDPCGHGRRPDRIQPLGSAPEQRCGQSLSHEPGWLGSSSCCTDSRATIQAPTARPFSLCSRARWKTVDIMVLARPFTNTEGGGELIIIDTPQYLENTQPTKDNIGVLSGPAQEDATVNVVSTEPGVPSTGRPLLLRLPDSGRDRPADGELEPVSAR